jgi:hypothetical protein
MEATLQTKFSELWAKYFPGAELPIGFYFTDQEQGVALATQTTAHRCVIANLVKVRGGTDLRFDAGSIGCFGGRRYLGFGGTMRPNFEYFLSCGIPGQLEGERYKQSPELVREIMGHGPKFTAPARFIVFKRWDHFTAAEEPAAVVFFATPDVLAGLFTLASFDESAADAVIAPFSAGCGSIVQNPYLEERSARPRCVIGLFDPSARPFVPEDVLTFAAPWSKFVRMVDNMEASFLITPTWDKLVKRISAPSRSARD